jgi:ferredoxin-NADP reductase
VARAAVLGRLTWRVATVVALRPETDTTSTLVLEVPDWPGHLAGQHVDVRLTAPDGYSVQRSYSIASEADSSTVELTIQRVPDGEVSSYLVGVAMVGDGFELRGPVGGYFTWSPSTTEPVLLVAGGSGIVPLMAMIRTRATAASRVPFRLIYSVRDPETVIYGTELVRRVRDDHGLDDHGLDVAYLYTRSVPPGHPHPPGRISAARLAADGWPAELSPWCYVCGPTGFVEAAADLLVAAGHKAERIRTERFG